jgi:hypothetical protein
MGGETAREGLLALRACPMKCRRPGRWSLALAGWALFRFEELEDQPSAPRGRGCGGAYVSAHLRLAVVVLAGAAWLVFPEPAVVVLMSLRVLRLGAFRP